MVKGFGLCVKQFGKVRYILCLTQIRGSLFFHTVTGRYTLTISSGDHLKAFNSSADPVTKDGALFQ